MPGLGIAKFSISKRGLYSGGLNLGYQYVLSGANTSKMDLFDVGLSFGFKSFWLGNMFGSVADVYGDGHAKLLGFGISPGRALYRFSTNGLGYMTGNFGINNIGMRSYSNYLYGKLILGPTIPLGLGIGEKALFHER